MKTFQEFIILAEASYAADAKKKSSERLNQKREIANQNSQNNLDNFNQRSKSEVEKHKSIRASLDSKTKENAQNAEADRKAKQAENQERLNSKVRQASSALVRGTSSVASSAIKSGLRRLSK